MKDLFYKEGEWVFFRNGKEGRDKGEDKGFLIERRSIEEFILDSFIYFN